MMGVHVTFGMREARAPPHFRGVLSTLHTGHSNMRGLWYSRLARVNPVRLPDGRKVAVPSRCAQPVAFVENTLVHVPVPSSLRSATGPTAASATDADGRHGDPRRSRQPLRP